TNVKNNLSIEAAPKEKDENEDSGTGDDTGSGTGTGGDTGSGGSTGGDSGTGTGGDGGAGTGDNGGSSGAAVTLSWIDSTAAAYIDGTVLVPGSVVIEAQTSTTSENSTESAAKNEASNNDSGGTSGGSTGGSGTTAGDTGTGDNGTGDILALPDVADATKTDERAGSDPILVAASLALAFADTKTDAWIGSNGRVEAADNVTVSANTEASVKMSAASEAEGADTAGISVSVAFADISNSATATVAPGAVVFAGENLDVRAGIDMPNDLSDQIWDLLSGEGDDNAELAWNVVRTALGEGEEKLTDNLTTNVRSGATEAEQDDSGTGTGGTGTGGTGDSTTGGASKKPRSSNLQAAGAFSFLNVTNTAQASIGDGAQINQPTTEPTAKPGQTVNVSATNSVETVDLVGIFSFPQLSEELTEVKDGEFDQETLDQWLESIDPTGSQNGTYGFGGSYNQNRFVTSTIAEIHSGAHINAEKAVSVTADSTHHNFLLTLAGGKAEKVGVDGAFGISLQDSHTIAQIHDGVTVNAGELTINAHDESKRMNIAGGLMFGANIGIGFGMALNEAQRETVAVFGNRHDGTLLTSDVTVHGPISITASATGNSIALALAGTASGKDEKRPESPEVLADKPINLDAGQTENGPIQQPDSTSGNPAEGDEKPASQLTEVGKPSLSIGIAGDVSVNHLTDTTQAFLRDAGTFTVNGSAVTITANNSTEVLGLGGAVAIAIGGEDRTSAGIAGSLGLNLIDGATEAFLEQAHFVHAGAVAVLAERRGRLFSLTASGSAAPKKKGIAAAASVVVNTMEQRTAAWADQISGDIASADIKANNSVNVMSIAGAAAVGGRGGFGASVAVNEQANSTSARLSRVNNLQHSGDVSVTAEDASSLHSITFSLGVALDLVAVSGTVSLNLIDNSVAAVMEDVSDTASSRGNINVVAADRTLVNSDAGAVALTIGILSAETPAALSFGVGVGVNDVANTITAEIVGSHIHDADSVNVEAVSTSVVESLTFAGAASVGLNTAAVAGVGAGSQNNVSNIVSAAIRDGASGRSVITSRGSVNVTAHDRERWLKTIADNLSVPTTDDDQSALNIVDALNDLAEITPDDADTNDVDEMIEDVENDIEVTKRVRQFFRDQDLRLRRSAIVSVLERDGSGTISAWLVRDPSGRSYVVR
ncbi:MAG: hypothetical protein KDA89_14795, partial [Planctomycetaceae bacterium]|nr:hypothetical protein [Planctomycetaceae bacterium]